MAQGIYVGIGGVAKKVSKIYVGVGGVAKKVKKVYVGVGGVAKLIYNTAISYYGTASNLSIGRYGLSSGSVGNYALFVGGGNSGGYVDNVDSYDVSLVKGSPSKLSVAKERIGSANAGNYLIFQGGVMTGGYLNDTADGYDSSLVHYNLASQSTLRGTTTGATVGTYALFGGGTNGSACVDIYNSSMGFQTTASLNISASGISSGNFFDKSYALFGGGLADGSWINSVTAFNSSLTKSTPTGLSISRGYCGCASNSDYIIFAGGENDAFITTNIVDAYDKSLTRYTPTVLTDNKYKMASISTSDYAIFACGQNSNTIINYADIYDTSLVKTTLNLSQNRCIATGTKVGDFALIAGGTNNYSDYLSSVEVLSI